MNTKVIIRPDSIEFPIRLVAGNKETRMSYDMAIELCGQLESAIDEYGTFLHERNSAQEGSDMEREILYIYEQNLATDIPYLQFKHIVDHLLECKQEGFNNWWYKQTGKNDDNICKQKEQEGHDYSPYV